jgi:hypothetical protein
MTALAVAGLLLALWTPAVPSTPPFAFLVTPAGNPSSVTQRVAVALWSDGQVVRVTGSGTYEVGRVGAADLERFVCELDAIDLWNFATDGPIVIHPADNIWLWRGTEKRGWLLAADDAGTWFPAFGETKQLLLSVQCQRTRAANWDGRAPAAWTSGDGQSVAAPRCRQLVDPLALLETLRKESPRDVVERLFRQPGRWTAVVDGVASGQMRWLEVASLLQPGTDAHSSEELSMAIEDAFVRSPVAVLKRF